MSAAPPAPASTITERPAALSRSTTFGTSATRHSPVAVSRGTPISVIFLFLGVAGQNSAGHRTVRPRRLDQRGTVAGYDNRILYATPGLWRLACIQYTSEGRHHEDCSGRCRSDRRLLGCRNAP